MAFAPAWLEWCAHAPAIVYLRDSKFGMPALQSVHLVGITVLLATIVVLNVRLAHIGMADWPLPWLERQLRPWTIGAVALVMLSGTVIFLGTPSKYLASNPFRVKMAALGLALVLQFGFLRRFFRSEPGPSRRVNLLVAGLSLTIWFTVGWAGRAIAFVP